MTIGGVNVGYRNPPGVKQQTVFVSAGIAASGAVTQNDFGLKQQDIVLHFSLMSETTLDSLRTALDTTAKPFGAVTVVPDSGDDLGAGITTSTSLIYVSPIRAQFVAPGKYAVDLMFRRYL
jgi:hypothetical protein